MPPLKLTVLVDNTAAGQELLAEHGLAFWIQADGRNILLDTGQTGILAVNAGKLGVDLAAADAIVLSHGHYDHTGGLPAALRAMPRNPRLFAHPAAFSTRFSRAKDGTAREVGIPTAAAAVARERCELVEVAGLTELGGGVFLTGPVPRFNDFEDTGGDFFTDAVCSEPDTIPDDQAVFIETTFGLVVALGCAHAGVVNTLDYISELTNGRRIAAVVGGMHLVNAGARRMGLTGDGLRRYNPETIAPCHCAGFAAMAELSREFRGVFKFITVGSTLEWI